MPADDLGAWVIGFDRSVHFGQDLVGGAEQEMTQSALSAEVHHTRHEVGASDPVRGRSPCPALKPRDRSSVWVPLPRVGQGSVEVGITQRERQDMDVAETDVSACSLERTGDDRSGRSVDVADVAALCEPEQGFRQRFEAGSLVKSSHLAR